MVEGHLRHDDNKRPALRVETDALRQTDLGLVHALGAALARAMEEQDEGPGLLPIPVLRQIDNETVQHAVDFDGTIQEARILHARSGPGGQKRKDKEKSQNKASKHCGMETAYRG